MRGLPTLKKQTSLPQTTTQRQRECDTSGLWVPTGPTSTTRLTTTTTTDSSHNARDNYGALKRNAYDKEGRHNTPKTTDQKLDHYKRIRKQHTTNRARELGLRFRASPPHSHQSNGAVERLRRTLFDQLRAVRWALRLCSFETIFRI